MTNYPTSVYAELTPNPSSMKFVSNRNLFKEGNTAEYLNVNQARGSSPLAEVLFSFPFVQSVFIRNNFVTITKTPYSDWDDITLEMREFIRDWLFNNEFAVTVLPLEKEVEPVLGSTEKIKPIETRPFEELNDSEQKIVSMLEEYVKPAVESDGGAIDFHSFIDGTVTVTLRGSCSGCPSSMVTLKSGVENLLKGMLPEVKEVVALEA